MADEKSPELVTMTPAQAFERLSEIKRIIELIHARIDDAVGRGDKTMIEQLSTEVAKGSEYLAQFSPEKAPGANAAYIARHTDTKSKVDLAVEKAQQAAADLADATGATKP